MKKLFVCFLLNILLLNSGHTHNIEEVMNNVLPSITYIRAQQFQLLKRYNSTTNEVIITKEPVSPIVGTGFIIDGNIVVTNHHVVEASIKNKTKISISFINDDTKYEATIVGYDIIADVALLKIDGNHPSVSISQCDDLRMGSEVFTISHFYAMGWSGTKGIVSSLSRPDNRYPYINVIQLQILSGTGSSGGPIFNTNGEVVGLNRSIMPMHARIATNSGSTRQLSMVAFPIRGDSLLDAVSRIKKEKVVVRVDIGVELHGFGYNHYLHTDPSFFTGVIVFAKDTSSKTVLRPNDLIISLDNKTFTDPAALLNYLNDSYKPGDIVTMQVYRDKSLLSLDITLEQATVARQ